MKENFNPIMENETELWYVWTHEFEDLDFIYI